MPVNCQEKEIGKRFQPSDGSLQRGHCVCLDDCLGRLGLHHDDLAKHLPLARPGRRLHSRLDHAESWDGDLAGLLHLLVAMLARLSKTFDTADLFNSLASARACASWPLDIGLAPAFMAFIAGAMA